MAKKVKVTKKQQELIETELRRGTNRSRISTLLEVEYEVGQKMIEQVQEAIRPDVGDEIGFVFRDNKIVGTIIKLLTNSAVVEIDWSASDTQMQEVLEERTIVNFKDIKEFISFAADSEEEEE